MSIAAHPEASRSITHFRCKKEFFYKIQYIVYDNFVWNNNYRKLEPTLYSQSMQRDTLLGDIITQVALWRTNKEANLEQ